MRANGGKQRTVLSLSMNEADRQAMSILIAKYKEERGNDEFLDDLSDSTIVKAILRKLATRVDQCEFDYRL